MRSQYYYYQLLMKKRNMKLKKYGSIENEIEGYNILCIKNIMGMSMTVVATTSHKDQ